MLELPQLSKRAIPVSYSLALTNNQNKSLPFLWISVILKAALLTQTLLLVQDSLMHAKSILS